MDNTKVEAYYRVSYSSSLLRDNGVKVSQAQNIIDSAQLDAIFAHFRTPLPTTFRVTGSRAYVPSLTDYRVHSTLAHSNVEDVNDLIKTVHVPELSDVVYEGQKQDPPQQIPWYALRAMTRGACSSRRSGIQAVSLGLSM